MAVLRRLLVKLGTFLRSHRAERELSLELESHLSLLEDDLRRRGRSPDQARLEARHAIGGIEQAKELHRDHRSFAWLEASARDVNYAARSLAKRPRFLILAVTTLGLAISANSAIFSAVYAILLRPPPIRQPNDLVMAWLADVPRNLPVVEVTYRQFEQWSNDSRAFVRLAALSSSTWPVVLDGRGDPVRLASTAVSASFFETLGTRAALGRVFRPDDDRRTAGSVVVLSHGLWVDRFGSDPRTIGTAITLDRKPHTVVGVMPRDFVFPRGTDLWVPVVPVLAESSAIWKTDALENVGVLYVVGRLHPGVTAELARQDLDALSRSVPGWDRLQRVAAVVPFLDHWLGPLRLGLWWLFAGVGLLLAVACANVSALVLTRSALKQREHATRLALGATRMDLARRSVVEILVVAALGGVFGLTSARWLVAFMVSLGPDDMPRLADVTIDLPVAGFTLIVVALSAMVCSVTPIMQASAANVAPVLNDASRAGAAPRSHRMRAVLVVLQISLAVVLLVAAGLIVRSFNNLRRLDLGFNPSHVLTMHVEPGSTPLPAREWFDDLIDRVESLPGVEAAGSIFLRPLAYGAIGTEVTVLLEGQPDTLPEAIEASRRNPQLNFQVATPRYFAAMRIPLLKGRLFDERDRPGAPRVVVVGERAAERLWPGENPIGKRLNTPQRQQDGVASAWHTVVGVVKDVHYRGIGDVRLDVYEPAAQSYRGPEFIVVRTGGDAIGMAAAVQAQARAFDRRVVIGGITTMEAIVARALAPWRLSSWMLALFSVCAFALAMIGLGGLVSLDVAERSREFAVRVALGAKPGDIMRTVLSAAGRRAAAGVTLGLVIAIGGTRALGSLLFGIEATDGTTYTTVLVLVSCVVAVASYLPARRVADIQPISLLRHE